MNRYRWFFSIISSYTYNVFLWFHFTFIEDENCEIILLFCFIFRHFYFIFLSNDRSSTQQKSPSESKIKKEIIFQSEISFSFHLWNVVRRQHLSSYQIYFLSFFFFWIIYSFHVLSVFYHTNWREIFSILRLKKNNSKMTTKMT